MHFNLQVLNLLHSLCDENSETPDILRSLGYSVVVVEPTIDLPTGRKCNPECVLQSVQAGNTMVIESKGGTGNSADQLARYEELSPGILLGAGLALEKAALKSLDLVSVCLPEHSARQLEQIIAARSSMRVISYSPASGDFRLVHGALHSQRLGEILNAGLTVPWPPAPHDFIPFDGNSSDVEIATAIAPSIVSQVLRRRKQFTCADICRDAIRYWHVLSMTQRHALVSRVERVVETFLVVGFPGQFQLVPTKRKGGFHVEVTAGAMRDAQRDPNACARKLLTMQVQAMTELTRRIETEQKSGQPPLFHGVALPPERSRSRRRGKK